ncbi:multicopper oxidase domain-containing protein [Mucilaginibacter rubeus]|uniref:Multicopper oxidase domain-containing protein n=1 Tax=Mucilaginibacter rubeus TaxID=2027860 RepID=A0AAE6JJR1_9SPHI|nr:multicopper oxidase domain-containing protein [Mucilaginibacter rubeus]QEM07137.1 multicopper oxidase domain-containing protein [Mucilaginibacter rubeus]QTE43718.1 multicopper oxidase domain-containing protein [Mucilaginibacter rubeus]QTE50317.1 multicopper oxidase domain-containing protein [Mucilaginibacter rubeus]QTE55404.1 multicopper oxidase domain-containing protein [Mucilaginibacter rubeus]QTE65134.1 multicopper oxidase domain-containing protein [Mucilaginibacter rubeus]
MKKILIAVLILCLKQIAFAQSDMQTMADMKKQQPITYTCPMHPEIHATKPGNCPKCGMKLVKEKPKAVPKKAAARNMPVKEKSMQMDDVPMSTNPATKAVSYTCPMHPEIHAAQPGNCPKCGMKLVKEQPNIKKMPDGMKMPVTDSTEQGVKMDDMDMPAGPAAKAHLEPIKTVAAKFPPRTVRYDLYIADTTVTYGGKPKRAIAVNGSIPMPTLTFTEGDTAEIYVHNKLKEETSLHWHGLFLPNRYDGVPNLTQMPIKPGATHLYKFPIKQHGTHWYHSHTGLQEQIGMYGAFIMNKREEWDIPTIPLVLSEWTNMNPKEVQRSLHAATDWFAIKKGTTQSYLEAIQSGHFKTKVGNEWKRMNAMDVSDVYYDQFLINGKNQREQPQFKAGDKVRLRIANAGASSYFWLKYAGGKMTVVATDGNDVVPVEVDRLIVAVSETYDVVVTLPENKSYEFLVTPEDRTRSASLWLGTGDKVYAGKMPKLKYFAGMKMMNDMMDMNGNMVEMDGMKMQNQTMDMNTVMYPEITGEEKPAKKEQKVMPAVQQPTDKSMSGMNMATDNADLVTLNYSMLRDPNKTTLSNGPWKELKFDLTGNMNRYVWTLDNKTVSESDKILIKKGENLRIILYNNSMMRHPMHLHGHDFRVLNGQGDNAPMKNVIDIMPMERDTIEFAANEPGGDWFFHCHILYHMMSGMGRIFSYSDSPPNPDVPDPEFAQRSLFWDDQMPHLMGKVGLESNGTDGQLMLGSTRWKATTMWRLGTDAMMGYESETTFGRYIGRNQWLFPYVGFDYHYKKFNPDEKNIFGSDYKNLFGQVSNKENRHTVVAGLAYTLPMLFVADMRIDANGKLRFQLGREDIPLTQRLRFNIMINTDKEYAAGLRYIVTKYFSFSTHYDSDMGAGAGLTITY